MLVPVLFSSECFEAIKESLFTIKENAFTVYEDLQKKKKPVSRFEKCFAFTMLSYWGELLMWLNKLWEISPFLQKPKNMKSYTLIYFVKTGSVGMNALKDMHLKRGPTSSRLRLQRLTWLTQGSNAGGDWKVLMFLF